MQLVYLTDIFEDIYNIVCVPFETDSVNVMKNMKEILITINLASSYQKTMEIVTRNNNTETFVNHTGLWQTLEKREDLEKYLANATSKL